MPQIRKTDTAMAAAFEKATVKPAEDRLYDLALSAMVKHADDTSAAIEQVWSQVQADAPMLVALFNPYGEYRNAISHVFHRLKRDVAIEQQRGSQLNARQRKAMKIIKLERENERREREEERRLEREEQARRDREYAEYLAGWHKTPLAGLTVGDKPVWEVSAGTVRAWLPTQRKKLRAVEMLIDGVPDDGRPISYYRTPDDVREIWKILGEENT